MNNGESLREKTIAWWMNDMWRRHLLDRLERKPTCSNRMHGMLMLIKKSKHQPNKIISRSTQKTDRRYFRQSKELTSWAKQEKEIYSIYKSERQIFCSIPFDVGQGWLSARRTRRRSIRQCPCRDRLFYCNGIFLYLAIGERLTPKFFKRDSRRRRRLLQRQRQRRLLLFQRFKPMANGKVVSFFHAVLQEDRERTFVCLGMC